MMIGESRGARLAPRDCGRGWVLLVHGCVCVSHLARDRPSLSLPLALSLSLSLPRRVATHLSEPLPLSLSPFDLRQA